MKKIIYIFSIGLVVICSTTSFVSAQSHYPERIAIQRRSLLGEVMSSWFSFFHLRRGQATPTTKGLAKDPYNKGVVKPGPTTKGGVITANESDSDPVCEGGWKKDKNGKCIPPDNSGDSNGGGGCASCVDDSKPDENGNCGTSNNGDNDGIKCGKNTCSVDQQCCNGMPFNEPTCYDGKYCSKCLSLASKIATPIGEVAVTNLRVGDIVWTADALGNRVVRSLIKVSRVLAINHRVVHLVLADGRTLDVSAPHPTADGRTVGDITVGDVYDGSTVRSAVLKPYEGSATYDILPAGDTGYYWANGILMGSTLK